MSKSKQTYNLRNMREKTRRIQNEYMQALVKDIKARINLGALTQEQGEKLARSKLNESDWIRFRSLMGK